MEMMTMMTETMIVHWQHEWGEMAPVSKNDTWKMDDCEVADDCYHFNALRESLQGDGDDDDDGDYDCALAA
ncbi:uncharacterized protein A4U43_C08F6830 [Asparagus officinalis]|nr:uncharacterized protein A4U43_C08F6830 [Asparagus officinalis]